MKQKEGERAEKDGDKIAGPTSKQLKVALARLYVPRPPTITEIRAADKRARGDK